MRNYIGALLLVLTAAGCGERLCKTDSLLVSVELSAGAEAADLLIVDI